MANNGLNKENENKIKVTQNGKIKNGARKNMVPIRAKIRKTKTKVWWHKMAKIKLTSGKYSDQ